MVENIALKILLRQGYLSTENNEISTELKKKTCKLQSIERFAEQGL